MKNQMSSSKPIDIYFFSGTGNTYLAIKSVRDYFEQNRFKVSLNRIEKTNPETINTENAIGLAFPVAALSTYPFIRKFINNLPEGNDTPVFMLDTMSRVSGGIVHPLKKILLRKGYKPIGAIEIIMPSNMQKSAIKAKSKQKVLDKGVKTARKFAHDLHYGLSKWKGTPGVSNLLYKISTSDIPWDFFRNKFGLEVNTSRCIQCGLCYRLCPADNIRMYEFPEFMDQCESCMRCFAYCPVDAIVYPKAGITKYNSVNPEDLLNVR